MSENLKQGLITCAAAIMFCLAVAVLLNSTEVIRSMLDALNQDRTEAVREVVYEYGDN